MRGRRDLVIQYAEFVAACRIRGVAHLLKGAPSIELIRQRENNKIQKKKVTALPFPPLEDMIAAAQSRFEKTGIPDDIEERLKKWVPMKKEEVANG